MGKKIHKFAEELSVVVPMLHREIVRSQARAVKTGDITFTQMVVLHLLKERGVCSMTEIAKMFSITSSGATGIVDRMVRAAFLKRVAIPQDRRVINIKLTLKGKKVINALMKQRKKMIVESFRSISAKEREAYLNTIKKIYGILRRGRR